MLDFVFAPSVMARGFFIVKNTFSILQFTKLYYLCGAAMKQ